jgi:hypothetical protein
MLMKAKKSTPKRQGATASQADSLRALLDEPLSTVDKAIRHFQAVAASINTDAAYEVKKAGDYFLRDVRTGINDVMTEVTTLPEWKPDDFAAAVLRGEVEDTPLIGTDAPPALKAPKGRRLPKQTTGEVVVADGPVVPRSKTR